MMRRASILCLALSLCSCVTSYRNHHLEYIPYCGHGPIAIAPTLYPRVIWYAAENAAWVYDIFGVTADGDLPPFPLIKS